MPVNAMAPAGPPAEVSFMWPFRTRSEPLRPEARLVPRTRSSHHIAARVFANFGFKSGTRIIDFASVPLIPRFASSVPQGRANLGIGTLAGERGDRCERCGVGLLEQACGDVERGAGPAEAEALETVNASGAQEQMLLGRL